jgi:hypothetical protein
MLDDIRIAMALLSDESDHEAAHGRADALLLETIEYLIAGENPVVETQAREIMRQFERLEKWYA